MENGVNNVQEVMLKVDSFDESNGGLESESKTVDVEVTVDGQKDENGDDLGAEFDLRSENGGNEVEEKVEDVFETPRVKSYIDPVEDIISTKVINEESTSGNTTRDQLVIENTELVDLDEHEEEVHDLGEVTEERYLSESTAKDHSTGLEADEGVNLDISESEVLNMVQEINEETISDNSATEQACELENGISVVDGKDEAKEAGVIDEVNTHTDALENNGVDKVDNEDNKDHMVILEDVNEVNKKPVLETSVSPENGVSDHVDLEEAVFHDDNVNGDSVSLITNPDGEVVVKANRDVNEEVTFITETKNVESFGNNMKEVEYEHDNLINVKNQLNDEPVVDSSPGQDGDKNLEQGSTSGIDEPVSMEEGTVICKVEDCEVKQGIDEPVSMEEGTVICKVEDCEVKQGIDEPVSIEEGTVICKVEDCDVKQDIMPVKKEPESRPVIGVSLPSQSPIPNSRPTTEPTPAPSPAPTRPAGLGSDTPLLEPAHRVVQPQVNGNVSSIQTQVIDEPTNEEPKENDETREKLQMIRVKFLRLARRLGQTPHNVVVAQVLYRLGLAEQLRGRNGGRVAAFSFERASAMAEQLEAAGQEPLEFSCTIMVLGKTGVGKSATINSIFDEVKFGTDAFQLGTKKVQDVVGTVQGIKVRVIDTPGLFTSWTDQKKNEKILHSVKRFMQKSPPDIVLYLDRMDMQSRDSGDMPLLRTITDIFGQSIWFNAIVVLTHAASAPPEGPNGTATSYEMFVTQRSHVVQQAIRQAAGDMRLMNPVSLVENHSACRTNRAGQRVLPNGQVWKPHLLLLSFASKILVEANMLLKLQDSPPGKTFSARTRAPPLPFILSNLLQSRPQLQLPQEQYGDDDDSLDDDVDESSDEESSEYDKLPPFKRLTSSQLLKLSKAQKKSYYDELEYREKLFMQKQLKEEKKRRRLMKKMAEAAKNFPTELTDNNVDEDSNTAATVPVAVQDMTLPASFDADNPTHRYRALDSANQWLIRPVLDPHGWDHDVGYEGINVEHLLALKEKIPVSFSGQVTKDKKDANLQMEVSSAIKHGKSNSTTLAFDMQTVGKEMSYTLRSETRFINFRKNKASAGLSAAYFGDTLTGGVKFEDKLIINKRGQLVVAGGAVYGRGDVAYGGSLEATLRDKDYPLGRFLSTVGLSVMDWHGDLALGWNLQSQIPIGRHTNLIGRLNLNNKGSGQVSVRLNSAEQLQIALVALVPLVSRLMGCYKVGDSAY